MASLQKVALVTGGTSGIGKEIARQLVKNGIFVFVNFSSSTDRATKAIAEIDPSGKLAMLFKADVSKESDVKGLYTEIQKKSGRLDYIINNAGIDFDYTLEEYPLESWDRILGVNLTGKFLCIKHGTPLLKKSADPRIINIASRLGTRPIKRVSAYSCAEAAIIMLTKVAALELASDGIKVNTVSPGLTRTPLTEKLCTEQEFTTYAKTNPCGRVGTCEDIANTVLFLLSKEAAFINGENINVSGGNLLV